MMIDAVCSCADRFLENRLFPTFRALYPDRKMILVLDNAAYHKKLHENSVRPKSMSKKELIKKLKEVNEAKKKKAEEQGTEFKRVQVWAMRRNGKYPKPGEQWDTKKEMPMESWSKAAPKGAYKEELIAAMEEEVRQDPDLGRTAAEVVFQEQSEKDGQGKHYHYMLFTPPNLPQAQPIEMVSRDSDITIVLELTCVIK